MKKLVNLSITFEITRRCNLKCEHCLRGDAEPRTATPFVRERVWTFVNNLYEREKLTPHFNFTGGEPMLVAKQIHDMILRMPESLIIEITTNGRVWNKYIYPLINTIIVDKYGDNYICISDDQFHRKEGIEIRQGWRDERNIYGHAMDIQSYERGNKNVLREGRAIENDIGINKVTTGGHFYINVFGDIYDCCDYSYETQRRTIPICNIFDDYPKLLNHAKRVGDMEEEQ